MKHHWVRPKLGNRLAATLTLAILAANALPSMANAGERVIIATTGGAYEAALRKAWFAPFTEKTGIEVITVAASAGEMRAQARAMVATGNVTWDSYFEGEIQASSPEHRQVAADLSDFCQEFSGRAELAENSCTSAGVRIAAGATLMAYNKDAFGGREPVTWADMWDLERFPGGRALPSFNDPWRVLAAALLADGVKREELFPLDVDRALAKLDELRPEITLWWKTGDQSVQGFRNGDYTIGEIWLTRATALKNEGRPVGWSYEAAFLVGDRATVIQGAPNAENAHKLLAYWLDNPQAQAELCEAMFCTPPSGAAIALMSDEARAAMPTAEQVENTVVVPDVAWINANKEMLLERWNSWIQ